VITSKYFCFGLSFCQNFNLFFQEISPYLPAAYQPSADSSKASKIPSFRSRFPPGGYVCPVEDVSIMSQLTYSWFGETMELGSLRPLTVGEGKEKENCEERRKRRRRRRRKFIPSKELRFTFF
jgi:hypothetical protein